MKKILVVEDDRHLNTGIAMALQGGTLTLDSAYDVSEAWDCLNRVAKETGEGYDLVILDVNLPDGSGLDLLMKLRNRSSIPVILLTANDMEADIVGNLPTEKVADKGFRRPGLEGPLGALFPSVCEGVGAGVPQGRDAPVQLQHEGCELGQRVEGVDERVAALTERDSGKVRRHEKVPPVVLVVLGTIDETDVGECQKGMGPRPGEGGGGDAEADELRG